MLKFGPLHCENPRCTPVMLLAEGLGKVTSIIDAFQWFCLGYKLHESSPNFLTNFSRVALSVAATNTSKGNLMQKANNRNACEYFQKIQAKDHWSGSESLRTSKMGLSLTKNNSLRPLIKKPNVICLQVSVSGSVSKLKLSTLLSPWAIVLLSKLCSSHFRKFFS